MLKFEEEIRKFKPSLEIEETEDLIMGDNLTDMTDMMVELLKEMKKDGGSKPAKKEEQK